MYDAITIFHMKRKPMQYKNIPKFFGHCPIFTEVTAKKNNKQIDRQIYHVQIKEIFKTGPP